MMVRVSTRGRPLLCCWRHLSNTIRWSNNADWNLVSLLRHCLSRSKMLSLSVSVASTSHDSIEIEHLVESGRIFFTRVHKQLATGFQQNVDVHIRFLTPVLLAWAISQRWCLSINNPEVRDISLPVYLSYRRKFLIFFSPWNDNYRHVYSQLQ